MPVSFASSHHIRPVATSGARSLAGRSSFSFSTACFSAVTTISSTLPRISALVGLSACSDFASASAAVSTASFAAVADAMVFVMSGGGSSGSGIVGAIGGGTAGAKPNLSSGPPAPVPVEDARPAGRSSGRTELGEPVPAASKSAAGTTSSANLTLSIFGTIRRGMAASVSSTVGAMTSAISCRGIHMSSDAVGLTSTGLSISESALTSRGAASGASELDSRRSTFAVSSTSSFGAARLSPPRSGDSAMGSPSNLCTLIGGRLWKRLVFHSWRILDAKSTLDSA